MSTREGFLFHRELGSPRTDFTMVLKTLEGRASTGAWKKSQLTLALDIIFGVVKGKPARGTAIVAPSTEAQVGPSVTNVVNNGLVAVPVEVATEGEVCAARENQQRTG